jgi:preprotein translocase subunit SecE
MSADNKEKRRRRRRPAQEEEEEAELEVDEAEEEDDDDEAASRGITAGKGRATPGRRNTQEVVQTGNAITRPIRNLREYLEGVNAEVRKVAWPTREETRRLTTIVILATIAASIILGIISALFTELFRLGLSTPIIFLVVFVVVAAAGFVIYRRTANTDVSPY